MIEYIIPLIACMAPLLEYFYYVLIALAFIATVPCIVRKIVKGW